MPTAELTLRTDEAEVLRYLGFPKGSDGATVDARVAALVEKAKAWAKSSVRPLASHATFDATITADGVTVPGVFTIRSASLAGLLEKSERVTLLAVTAGPALDAETSRLSSGGRMAEAAVLDALGSDAVEQAADDICSVLESQAVTCGFRLTRRFSPGYGDLSLEHQPALVEASGAKAIGIEVSPSMMLSPMKSVTALVGWEPAAPALRLKNQPAACDSCESSSCRFRRPGPKE